MRKIDDEKRIKTDEIQGYTDYASDTEGLNWTDSIDSINETIKQHAEDVQWQYVQQFIEPKRSKLVLDCGSGRCWASFLLAKDGCEVIAVDMNTDKIVGLGAGRRIIEETGIAFHLVCADLEYLPFKEGIFDLAFGSQFLHHAYSLENMLREISNVLVNEGMLIALNEHSIPVYMKDDEAFRLKHPAVAHGANEHAYHHQQYVSQLEEAGLKNISSFPYPYWEEYLRKQNTLRDGNTSIVVRIKLWLKSIVFLMLRGMFQTGFLKGLAKWIIRSYALTSFSFIAAKNAKKSIDLVAQAIQQ